MAAIDQKLIDRINELAAKQKAEGLSDEEKAEQQALRTEYIRLFRSGFEQQLQNIKVVDPEGNDVTPSAVKNDKN